MAMTLLEPLQVVVVVVIVVLVVVIVVLVADLLPERRKGETKAEKNKKVHE